MAFRVPAPFDALVDGTSRQVAGRGERALLALLALSPGKVVATATLVDRLCDPDRLRDTYDRTAAPTELAAASRTQVARAVLASSGYGEAAREGPRSGSAPARSPTAAHRRPLLSGG
jgi:hypothetical protein